MSDQIIVIDRTESIVASVFKDIVTTCFVGFCVWISLGSKWWTFVTGLLFIVCVFGKISNELRTRRTLFRTKKDLEHWVEDLEWKDN